MITGSYNSLEYLDDFVEREIEKNFNVSFSGLFKRHRMKVPLIGDYLILKRIVRVAFERGKKKFTRFQLRRGASYSIEFEQLSLPEKNSWIEDFYSIYSE